MVVAGITAVAGMAAATEAEMAVRVGIMVSGWAIHLTSQNPHQGWSQHHCSSVPAKRRVATR